MPFRLASKTVALRVPILVSLILSLGACTQLPQKTMPAVETHPPTAADVDTSAVAARTTADDAAAANKKNLLNPLAWLSGCWKGGVDQRDYREHWLPLRGELLLGTSHTVAGDKTQNYQFLRMNVHDGAVYYVIAVPDEKEYRFKLAEQTTEGEDVLFTFANLENAFPQTIAYRKSGENQMSISIAGTLKGAERKAVYPIRRIDCTTNEFITK